jgi:glucose-1-phosphate thymidylyltransferase
VSIEWIGLVPAAGKGLRLGLPYPKELYPIIRNNRYKPVSQFIVDQMITAGVKHIVFVVNETKHQLIGYFGSGARFSCHFTYVVQEQPVSNLTSTSPGLSHALDAAYHLTQGKLVFFGMPDTIIQPGNVFIQALSYLDLYEVVLCLLPTQTPEKFGMVKTTADGRAIEIVDKPSQSDLTKMWGCILWKPAFTEYLHKQVAIDQNCDFAHVMNSAIREGMPFGSASFEAGNYIDLGTYDEIQELDKRLREID